MNDFRIDAINRGNRTFTFLEYKKFKFKNCNLGKKFWEQNNKKIIKIYREFDKNLFYS